MQTTIPAANAPAVAAYALCDGTGLVVIPTEDGPWQSACTGCRACTATQPPESAERVTASVLAMFAATADDDEPF